MAKPIAVSPRDAAPPPGPPTAGMDRRQLLDEGDRWIGFVRTDPGLAGGWHHHGDRDTYVFNLSGELVVEFGSGGGERITLAAGDFGYIPPRTVHREVTGPEAPVEAFVVRIGPGPQNVNVDGPDADPNAS